MEELTRKILTDEKLLANREGWFQKMKDIFGGESYETIYLSGISGHSEHPEWMYTDPEKWMEEVKKWSRENDRFEVSMHTVGGALSYVKFDELGLIEPTIMAELNKIENDDLRKGYKLGIVNQRGVHWVDPEGREEKELARTYQKRAENVEKLGYSRFAGLLRDIATGFLAEAQDNIQRCRREEESLLTEV